MITCVMTDDVTKALLEIQREFPQQFGFGMVALGRHMRSRMAKELAAQVPAGHRLKDFSQTTMALRRAQEFRAWLSKQKAKPQGMAQRRRRKTDEQKFSTMAERRRKRASERMGGMLGKLIRYDFDQATGMLKIGWIPGNLSGGDPTKAAASFQESSAHSTTKKERSLFHRKNIILGNQYIHPERSVIGPYERDPETAANAVRIVGGAIDALISGKTRSAKSQRAFDKRYSPGGKGDFR